MYDKIHYNKKNKVKIKKNNCENKGSKKQRRKGNIYPFEFGVLIASRDKKAFLSNQCKEIGKNKTI